MDRGTLESRSSSTGRLRVLASAVQTFADATLEYGRLHQTIVVAVAEALACGCGIALVSSDGRMLEPLARHDPDSAAGVVVRALLGVGPTAIDAPTPATQVLASGESILVRAIDPAEVSSRFSEVTHLAPRSYVLTPLKAHGTTIGVLALVRHGTDAAPFEDEEASFARSLADHAALALVNARLLDDARRMTERLRVLSALAREFSASTDDYDALLPLVVRRLSEVTNALCVLRFVSPDGLLLESVGAVHHPDPELLALAKTATALSPQRVGEGISGRVAETGEPILVRVVDLEAVVAKLDPERRGAVERQRITSIVAAPLLSRGRSIGVVSLSRSDRERPFEEDDLRLLEDVAAHASLAIVNARAIAAERAARAASERAQGALHESEEAHRLLFEASPVPVFVFDVETLYFLAANEAAVRLFGYDHHELMKMQATQLTVASSATARARLAAWGDAESTGTARYHLKNGSAIDAEYTTRALTFAARRARIVAIKDVTAQHRADETRALLAAIVEASNDAIVSKRLDGTISSWNAGAERLFGYSAAEAIGQSITLIVPTDRLAEQQMLMDRVAAGQRVHHHETFRLRKDGTSVAVSLSLAPVLDATGNVVGVSKTAHDLTALRRATEALRRTEEQLRQAQKMDAIGRLAGGIAHDFNNLLCVILSHATMALEEIAPESATHEDLDEIRKAAERAADLTRQLLVFSWQQVIEAKVLDLNAILAGMDKMLKRILGEDISLAVSPSIRLGSIRADPGNIEQVVMNLVVNARDAMPTGGKLTIETRNVVVDEEYAGDHLGAIPGPHVMLAVTDTGVGMDAATQARIFEPFFTTKEAGRGTGLGLSTVFGIAQQSGGSVWVYSEPGKGTTFKVYFPRVEATVDKPISVLPPVTMRGKETILLVEDQEQVRLVAREILQRNGYRTLVACDGAEALALSAHHRGTIHLLLTDVVMPNMSGAELATRIVEARPGVKILYVSGYTDDSIVRHGVLESGMAFLQKPFTPESLTRKVREVLNASPVKIG